MTAGDSGGRRLWLALAIVILLFAFGAVIFARVQNVWIDESTQLSGMTLSPDVLLGWLAGRDPQAFGVPGDRMPPLSYLIDMAGWHIWGNDVLAFRLYHAAFVAAGMLVLMLAMARRFSGAAAVLAGLFLALSPKLIDTAVEIRAYPIFFAIACCQVALLVQGDVAARSRRLILFLLLGLAAGYTHFFGVIATGAFFLAVLIDAPSWRAAIRAMLGFGVVLLLWGGLAPFVTGAAAISTTGGHQVAGPALAQIVIFCFQLVGIAAQMVNPVLAALYFAGTALLLLLLLIALVRMLRSQGLVVRHQPALGIVLGLLAGLAVTIAAAFLIKGFSTLTPRYNIWMLPALAVLLAVAADGVIAAQGRIGKTARLGALALLAIGTVGGQVLFLARADWYIHGPSTALEAMLRRAGPGTAVVYIGRSWPWGFYPLYWRHRDDLDQWVMTRDGELYRIGLGGDPQGPVPLAALAAYPRLLVNHITFNNYGALRELPVIGPVPGPAGPIDLAPPLSRSGWAAGEAVAKPGYYEFTGQVYQKRQVHQTAAR